jgi:tRNA pseudouridine38-40 synthase
MVRIIAGTLIQIGQDKLPEDSFLQAIEQKDRLLLGPTAPAKGLTLYSIDYQEGDNAN